MSRAISIDAFVADLARFDDRTIGLLDAYFRARHGVAKAGPARGVGRACRGRRATGVV
jgi:hypothetical protein